MTAKIEKVLNVVDTRQYEEIGDKWKPIPGSGQLNTCYRCGRSHEVHATVELSDGTAVIVGTGCMKGENAEVTSKIKSLTSTSKRLAKLRAEETKYEAMISKYNSVKEEVEALTIPPISESTEEFFDSTIKQYYTMIVTKIGNTEIRSYPNTKEKDRHDHVTKSWQDEKMTERGITYYHQRARYDLTYTQKAIDKVLNKIESLQSV